MENKVILVYKLINDNFMYLGKASMITIASFDKQLVIDGAKEYCEKNEGWMIWNNVYSESKWKRWFTWQKEYKIDLYKPIDFAVTINR